MPTTPKPTIKVVPGQIWADKDPRSAGRYVRITEIDCRHAYVERVTRAGQKLGGRTTRILHDHRGLRGYRLVSQPEGEA